VYKATIKITAEMIEKIEKGEIKIKSGQWVQYEWLTNKSRFVGVTRSGSVWAVHSKYGKFNIQAKRIQRFK
tara:strand:+ start:1322 stop:1534 length:213 start_codon:yes stop_codon:yes gene_type:complete